jgi:hypothetical protein
MATRTVRLNAEEEAALERLMKREGVTASAAIKGVIKRSGAELPQSKKAPWEIYVEIMGETPVETKGRKRNRAANASALVKEILRKKHARRAAAK